MRSFPPLTVQQYCGEITDTSPALHYSQSVNCNAIGYIHSRSTVSAEAAAPVAPAENLGTVDNPESIPELQTRDRPRPLSDPGLLLALYFKLRNQPPYWAIPIRQIGQIHARGCWLFAEDWYGTGIIPAIGPACASATREGWGTDSRYYVVEIYIITTGAFKLHPRVSGLAFLIFKPAASTIKACSIRPLQHPRPLPGTSR